MLPSRHSVLPILLSAVLAIALAACSEATARPPAATVAGSSISTDDLARTAGVFNTVAGLQQQPCGQTDGATDTQEAACNRFSLGAMILFRLSDQYAAQNNITVDDAKVTKAFETFQKNVGADTLHGQLSSNGVTEDDVRELVRASIVQQEVAKALAEAQFTDQQLQQQYQQSIGDYTTLHVDHILVDSKGKAEEVYKQVTAPGSTLQDFQNLAKQVSTDPQAKQTGGELTLPASQLVSEFSDAALKLKPGEISKPVHTQYGWHVIYMIDKQVTPFAQARDKILQQVSTKAFQDYVQSQVGQIQVDPSFGRFDPTTLQVQRISSTDPSATQAPPSGAVNGAPATP
ncbi:MAG TPA: peptidylprolyl isomerase [Actinomycetota bacterium]|jgi:foldase protein PrsA|nr:peptidylprolyl isomerase [Actinomycetota bacterium]